MPTVGQIARHAGVAKSTVSLVLNNKPGVSEEMRHRVLEAMDQLHATEEAQSLASLSAPTSSSAGVQRTGTETLSVVVLHPPILRSSQVFSELLQGIRAGAATYQMQLNLAVNEPSLPDGHITHLYFTDPSLRPDGVLIIGARQHEPLIEEARELGIPCVLVGRQSADPTLAAVGRNEEEVTLQATNHLLDLGHRAVAFVGGDEAYSYTHSRLSGYRRALEQTNGSFPDRWIALGDGRTAAARVLASSPEITAVIFINDAYAMEGLPVFQANGRVIPDKLSVISFDDTEDARSFEPPLTSVSYPRFQEGLWSMKILVDHIRQPLMKSCQVVFRASLIQRDSCTSPKRA